MSESFRLADATKAERLAHAETASEWRDVARQMLAEHLQQLRERFEKTEAIEKLIAARCAMVDTVVQSAWQRCFKDNIEISLLATGGYGRTEMYPHSDIDLLIVANKKQQKQYSGALSGFYALLWDCGLASSHAVRSVDECLQAAKEDITVLTALMELRLLAGPDVIPDLSKQLSTKNLWSAKAYFIAKREEQRARHARFNDTADNLEPNLKEGPGSLRDFHTLSWMAKRLYTANSLHDLVPIGVLGEDECQSLEREWRVLARLRFGLHLISKRKEERLVFDHQKVLAALMGLKDISADNLAVEQMMQDFFRSAATMRRINDRLLQRFDEQLAGKVKVLPVANGFELRQGYLAMTHPATLQGGMMNILHLFEVWALQKSDCGLHSETARSLAEALPVIRAYSEESAEAHDKFLHLLQQETAVLSLTRMARLGVLSRYLPAFGKVVGRMQYDLFHVYTVDQHTLTVLRIMDGYMRGPLEGFSMAHEVVPHLRKPHLLILAGLFHDIAKGRGGDHAILGADDVREFCIAHDISTADTELLAWLVKEHLVMSVTAQRQDISDPEVVTRFATRVADREHLEYLYLLTCADIAGTSPKLWNAWKDRLLADLYTATRFVLRRGLENKLNADDIISDTRETALATLMDRGVDADHVQEIWKSFPNEAFLRYRPEQIVWQSEGILKNLVHPSQILVRGHQADGSLEIFVRTQNRDGLFAALVATIDRLGMSVLEARILNSSDGYALDSFQVQAAKDDRHTHQDIVRAIEIALRDPSRVHPARRMLPRHIKHFKVPTRLDFSASEDGTRTRLSLVCTDQPGLLAKVAAILRTQHMRVHDARIATFGERVEDFFLISDEQDRAIVDEHILEQLQTHLIACVEGDIHAKH